MEEKIKIPIGLDTSGVSADIRKASDQVGKAATGMTKGLAAALGAQLGPFGELIEKADALKAAMGGITGASKAFALATAGIGAATAYGVTKAIDAYKEMKQAIDDAASANKRLGESMGWTNKTIASGIAAGQEGRAVKLLNEQLAQMEKEKQAQLVTRGTGEDISYELETQSEINDRLKRTKFAEREAAIRKQIETIVESVARGESRLGDAALTPEGRRALEEAAFQATAATYSVSDLPGLKKQRQETAAELTNLAGMPMTTAVANQANAASEWAKTLDRLIAALEERAKAEEEHTKNYLDASGEVKEQPKQITKAEAQSYMPSFVPSSFGVGGYTSTGGGGNIYGGARQGMEMAVKSISQDVKKIAETVTTNEGGLAP